MIFADYVEVLRSQISRLGPKNTQDLSWVADDLETDVHLFYEAKDHTGSVIRLWSVNPTLRNLLDYGPKACLDRRLREPRSASRSPSPAARRKVSFSNPTIKVFTPEAVDFKNPFETSGGSTNGTYTDLSHSTLSDKETTATPTPRTVFPKPTLATDLERRSVELRPTGPLKRAKSLGSVPHSDTVPDRKPMLDTSRLAPRIRNDRYDSNEHHLRLDLQKYQLPDQSSQRFRWVHVPANNMAWVADVFSTLGEECNKLVISRTLLSDSVWTSKQNTPRHGSPHGRFMVPHCELFLPRSGIDASRPPVDVSPVDQPQLVVYVSLRKSMFDEDTLLYSDDAFRCRTFIGIAFKASWSEMTLFENG